MLNNACVRGPEASPVLMCGHCVCGGGAKSLAVSDDRVSLAIGGGGLSVDMKLIYQQAS